MICLHNSIFCCIAYAYRIDKKRNVIFEFLSERFPRHFDRLNHRAIIIIITIIIVIIIIDNGFALSWMRRRWLRLQDHRQKQNVRVLLHYIDRNEQSLSRLFKTPHRVPHLSDHCRSHLGIKNEEELWMTRITHNSNWFTASRVSRRKHNQPRRVKTTQVQRTSINFELRRICKGIYKSGRKHSTKDP